MSMRRSSVLLVSILSLAACGVKLPGGLKVATPAMPGTAAAGNSGSGLAATTTETAASTIGPSRKVDKKLVAYYQSLDQATLHTLLFDRARDEIYEQAKADVGRDLLWQSGNPDPTWIKVWNTKDWSYASQNAETMMQAAFNRTWEDGCKAGYAKTRAAHDALAAQFAPELAAVDALPNHYARRAGYVALAVKYEEAATAAGLDPSRDPIGAGGFRVVILQHAVAHHAASPRAYASFDWDAFPQARDVRERGRTFTSDAAFELAAYCGAAADHGAYALASFGSLWGSGHASNATVAWPTVWGDQDAIEGRVKQLVAEAGKALEIRDGLRIGVVRDAEGIDFADEEPKLARVEEATIDKVTPAGDGVKLAISRKRSESFAYNCRETRQIDRIEDDGRIVYRSTCKYGDKTFSLQATVTFAELPPGLALAKGDVITFTGDVDADASKKVKDTASKIAYVRTTALTGRVLERATRKGKPLF